MLESIFEISMTIIDLTFLLVLFSRSFLLKIKSKKSIIGFISILSVFVYLVDSYAFLDPNLSLWRIPIYILVFIISIKVIFKEIGIAKLVIGTFIYMIILAVIETSVVLIYTSAFKIPMTEMMVFSIHRVIFAALKTLVLFPTVYYVPSLINKLLQTIKYVRIIGTLFVILMIALNSYYSFTVLHALGKSPNGFYLTSALMLLGVTVVTYLSAKQISNLQVKNFEYMCIEDRLHDQKQYEESMSNMMKVLRMKQHDFINHIQVIRCMVELEKYDDVSEYIKDLSSDSKKITALTKTKNAVIDSILNYHSEFAKENEIKFDITASKVELGFIGSLDFTSILTNLLNNANEACLRVESDKRWIRIELLQEMNQLLIKVENSKSEKFSFEKLGTSSKENAKEHGFGLGIVDQLVKKYEGKFNYVDKGEEFVVNLSMGTVTSE